MKELGRWPVKMTIPVAWGEMDAFRHVNNVVFIRWFESVRIRYFERVGIVDYDGVGPILAKIDANYRRPVFYPDTVTVEATVKSFGNTSFVMGYRVKSEKQGELVADGEGVIVMYDYQKGQKVALPESLRSEIFALEGGSQAV